ncbi:MAG: cytochrome c oxidase subunit II [Solirubrobacteraceae bacterium]
MHPLRARLRPVLLVLLAVLPVLLVFASSAFGDAFTPESGGSRNADEIDSLYKIVLVVAVIVFLGVEGALFYSLFKFRARKGATAAQIHGNTRLEIGWTLGAALILVFLTVVTFLKLGPIQNPENSGPDGLRLQAPVLTASTKVIAPPDGKKLNICVTGRQYIWRYTYAVDCNNAYGKPFAYEELTVPANTTVTLDIQSTDVAHSWWIPKLGGKFDALPGYHNYTWFKAPKPGVTYTGECAELCGRNHANMTARVRVVSPAEYETFMQNLQAGIAAANKNSSRLRDELKRAGQL